MTEGAEVAAASRVVVAMLEVAREQGVSKRRLAIQMILRGGLMLGAAKFRKEARWRGTSSGGRRALPLIIGLPGFLPPFAGLEGGAAFSGWSRRLPSAPHQ
jgi:hypothetical protein